MQPWQSVLPITLEEGTGELLMERRSLETIKSDIISCDKDFKTKSKDRTSSGHYMLRKA